MLNFLKMINEPIIYTLVGLSTVCTACIVMFYYYYNKTSCQTVDKLEKPIKKTIIFLDIDGTLTRKPGSDRDSLFNMYLNDPRDWALDRDKIIQILFESEYKLKKIQRFIQQLINTEHIELVITTNNYRNAVKQLWEEFIEIPWDAISLRSAFRDSPENKLVLINKILREESNLGNITNAIYFEDDITYIPDIEIGNNLKILNCHNNWLGNQL